MHNSITDNIPEVSLMKRGRRMLAVFAIAGGMLLGESSAFAQCAVHESAKLPASREISFGFSCETALFCYNSRPFAQAALTPRKGKNDRRVH